MAHFCVAPKQGQSEDERAVEQLHTALQCCGSQARYIRTGKTIETVGAVASIASTCTVEIACVRLGHFLGRVRRYVDSRGATPKAPAGRYVYKADKT
jgi:hypothetical protein